MKYDTSRDITEDIIKRFEGLETKAYKDIAGYGTIGYGHLITDKDKHLANKTMTQQEAEELLRADIRAHQKGHIADLKKPVTSNQMAALTSFAFNLGAHSKGVKQIVDALNRGDDREAADVFLRYDKVKDQETGGYYSHSGLTKRRELERSLFLTRDGVEFEIPDGKKPATVSAPQTLAGDPGISEQQKVLASWEMLTKKFGADLAANDAAIERLRREGRGI